MTDTTDAPRAEVYRLRLAVARSHSSSSGEVEYFESRLRLEDALLAAQLDALIEDSRGGDRTVTRRRRLWRDFLKGSDYPHITRIVAVERFDDGTWTPLEVAFTEPTVVLTERSA